MSKAGSCSGKQRGCFLCRGTFPIEIAAMVMFYSTINITKAAVWCTPQLCGYVGYICSVVA